MDFQSQASSWTIQALDEDIFGDSLVSCAGSSWERAPYASEMEPSVDTLRAGRYTTPGPSVTCVDPKLTVLWSSPPASPSEEEASVDGACTASEDWPQDLVDAHFQEATSPPALDAETSSSRSSPSREPRKTKPTTKTQVTTRAAARNSRAMVKGPDPDKTHATKKWKCRARGGIAPSSSSPRVSSMGPYPDPGPSSSKGDTQKTEGIVRIHTRLWKCRIGGCDKTFHRKGDAVRHLQTTAKHNGKAVVCGCGAPFSRHDALKRHQRLCGRHGS